MVYEIVYGEEAKRHLKWIPASEQRKIEDKVEVQLKHEPETETRNRKPLRQPNTLGAKWELRVQPYRVYYNVDTEEQMVWVVAVGHKPGSDVFIAGKKVEL